MRASLVRGVGAFRQGFDGSQDHDLALRVTEQARKVVHVPEILYHWRVVPGSAAGDPNAKPYAWEAGRKAVPRPGPQRDQRASESVRCPAAAV